MRRKTKKMLIDWFYMQWSSRSTNQIEVENLIRTFSRNLKGNQRLNTLILQAHVIFICKNIEFDLGNHNENGNNFEAKTCPNVGMVDQLISFNTVPTKLFEYIVQGKQDKIIEA